MFLLAGIGNIGKKYSYTRHNVGFLIIDAIIKKYECIKEKDNFESNIYKGSISKNKVILVKPMTFVNNSGIAISKIVSFYKIPLERVFIFHDDLDLKLSRVKIKIGGSAAGHNGLKSIDINIGKNYNRVRVGIGNNLKVFKAKDYVLAKFSKKELDLLEKKITILVDNINFLFSNKQSTLLNILTKA